MPHRALLPATTALGWALYAGVVTPYKLLARFDATRALAEKLPLRIYADYPVRVIVNDQFDRFSAPIENRYRRDEVAGWLARAGLVRDRHSPRLRLARGRHRRQQAPLIRQALNSR